MAVPRLEHIIISKTIHQQWLASHLPMLAYSAMRYNWDKNCKNQVAKEIVKTTEKYMSVLSLYPLPSYLKQQWATTFNGIAREAVEFLVKLRQALSGQSQDDYKQFVKLTVFSQNCEVDTRKTILEIMDCKEFKIKFDKNFMFDHLVLKDDLMKLLEKAYALIESKAGYRCAKIISKEKESLQSYFSSTLSSYKDMKEVCQQALQGKMNFANANLDLPNTLQIENNPKLLKYLIQVSGPSVEDVMQYTRKHYLNGKRMAVAPEMAIILLDYIGLDKFFEATEYVSEKAFGSLLGSWRSRHHCPEYFARLCARQPVSAARAVLAFVPPLVEPRPWCQLAHVLRRMWTDMPSEVRQDRQVYNAVPMMIKDTNYNKDFIELLLKDYSHFTVAVKGNAILMSTIKIVLKLEKDEVVLADLTKVVRQLYGDKHAIYLNKRQLKMLIDVKNVNLCKTVTLESLLALSRVDATCFKRAVAVDFDFVKSFMTKNWGFPIFKFFEWLRDGEEQAEEYLQRADATLVQPVFQLKLAKQNARVAVAGLRQLRAPLEPGLSRALRHSALLADVLAKMLDDAAARQFDSRDWEVFTSDRERIQKLLVSSIGRQKIISLITKPRSRNVPQTVMNEYHNTTLQRFQNLRRHLLEPAQLCAVVDAVLVHAGHPNSDPQYDQLGSEQRLEVDFKYRCLRAVLARDVPLTKYLWTGAGWGEAPPSLLLVSTQIAAEAELEVPVVL